MERRARMSDLISREQAIKDCTEALQLGDLFSDLTPEEKAYNKLIGKIELAILEYKQSIIGERREDATDNSK